MMAEWTILRPWWLLAVLPLLLVVVMLFLSRRADSRWLSVIDPALREYVLEPVGDRSGRWPILLLALLWLLAVLALAGPVWEQRPAPAYRSLQSMVIALDLSRSMDADDLGPSRLARAKHKLTDLLDQASGIQVGLVVFSEVAYVVSPLTDDVDTLKAFLPSLQTDVVPVQGSRLLPAIEKSLALLKQSQVQRGAILLITDAQADAASVGAAGQALDQGFRISILGAGTPEGGPIRRQGGSYLQDGRGNIVIAKLDSKSLQQLANAGGGAYQTITVDDGDLEGLATAIGPQDGGESEAVDREIVQWVEYAPWLLLLILPFAALSFRRGVL